MPFSIGDYLSDTMHLTTIQHGAYFLLILAYWKNRGPLLIEDLGYISKLNDSDWEKYHLSLERFFDINEMPGFWVHHRIERDLKETLERIEKNTKRGKAGAAARYGKEY